MIKYEVTDEGVRILDIGNIKRGCGLVYDGSYDLHSEDHPAYYGGNIYIHGTCKDGDDDVITGPDDIIATFDEYNASIKEKNMIKYEVTDEGLRILDIGSIERGCGLIYKGVYSIHSNENPAYIDDIIYIHGKCSGRDDDVITEIPSIINSIVATLDEYNGVSEHDQAIKIVVDDAKTQYLKTLTDSIAAFQERKKSLILERKAISAKIKNLTIGLTVLNDSIN